jgi:glycosyltransferase involved in cell wall biosynthesis
MPPLLSVVIPCYAQGHFLREAVESVLAQDYPRVELIVVNDGSPDTPVLEAALAPFRDRLTYIVRENGGIAAARNTGLTHCTGEYVIFLDADDRLLANAAADGVAALSADPARGLVWGLRHLMDVGGVIFRQHTGRIGNGERYPDLLQTNIVGPPSGTMWRRTALEAIGGFSSVLPRAEDYDAYLRMAQQHGIHCHGATVL